LEMARCFELKSPRSSRESRRRGKAWSLWK
jgi:hypothetical protein